MFGSLWGITRNAFDEVIRQPIYGILVLVGVVMIGFSPLITMFTMMEDVKLVMDMGLGTIFMVGIALAVLSATQVISREIESKTAGAIMSKPVGRFLFVGGKFLGVAMAMAVACYLLTIILLMTVRMNVPSTASYKVDWPVFLAEVLPLVGALAYGLHANYFYRSNFTSSAVLAALPLYTLAMGALLFISQDWSFDVIPASFVEVHVGQVAWAALLVFLGVCIISAVAVAVSTRFDVVANVLLCLLVFFVGMVSHYLFGWTVDDSWIRWVPGPDTETVAITGRVTDPEGEPVAEVRLGGAPGGAATGPDGYFRFEVARGESGTVRPRESGYAFRPAERTYTDILSNQANQDFAARRIETGAAYYGALAWQGTAWVVYHVVPSLQVYWVADQLMRPDPYIPPYYVAGAGLYAVIWCTAMVVFGAFLFERREII